MKKARGWSFWLMYAVACFDAGMLVATGDPIFAGAFVCCAASAFMFARDEDQDDGRRP